MARITFRSLLRARIGYINYEPMKLLSSVKAVGAQSSSSARSFLRVSQSFLLALLCSAALSARAEAPPQFDVFLGYDGLVPEATWFPIEVEVKNDGPPFIGIIEVEPGNANPGQARRMVVELPTGTLKRLSIPMFSSSRGYASWDVRLLDERGKVRAEQLGLRARKLVGANTPIIGALPRTSGGTPSLRPIMAQSSDMQPASARFQAPIVPDNPLVLEGMDTFYLNSEKATELRVPNQVDALFDWINDGGHLVVAVEQVNDITATPWLRTLFPCDLKDMRTVQSHPEIQEWLRSATAPTNEVASANAPPRPGQRRTTPRPRGDWNNPFSDLQDDATFEGSPLQVATGTLREGRVIVAAGDIPLIISAPRGRGRVTALLFSPEREPFRSWKNLPTFWARLSEIPPQWYVSGDFNRQGGWSSDGIFGAMIDTRQVHKLPVGWLLLLLMVYLVVIGPADQLWLKRIGRPMLTWITFPCYVVLFSLLIYFIGYKLRAGESEWNELHVVDVLPHGEKAELRGRTYASVYSPANQKYQLESHQKFATFRGEFVGSWGGSPASERATVIQSGEGYKAEIFVPVWTSQLFVSDWWEPGSPPLSASVTSRGGEKWDAKIENLTDTKFTNVCMVIDGYLMRVGEIAPNETKTVTLSKTQGKGLREFVTQFGSSFQPAVSSRQRALGSSESGWLSNLPESTVAASFISQMFDQGNYMRFIAPPGLDLTSVVDHGNAVVFAWADNYAPVKPIYKFSPRRSQRHTMFRLAVPVQ
jgi:hypothetical protein